MMGEIEMEIECGGYGKKLVLNRNQLFHKEKDNYYL
jgi:hypothetical protein